MDQDVKHCFLIAFPHITTGENQYNIGEHWVQADFGYHIRKSLEHVGYKVSSAIWSTNENCMLVDVKKSLAQLQTQLKTQLKTQFEEHDPVIVVLECNFNIKENEKLLQLINAIVFLRNNGANLKIVTLIPDSWPRNDLLIIVNNVAFSDRIVLFNEAIIAILQEKGLDQNIAKKCVYTPILPIVYRDSSVQQKNIDFCYIGSSKGYRIMRIGDMMLHRNMNLLIYTAGREPSEFNLFRHTEDYMKALSYSKYSILSAITVPRYFRHTNGRLIRAPGQIPGRFAESLATNTIPIYFQEDSFDTLPSEFENTDCQKPFIIIKSHLRGKEILEFITEHKISTDMIKTFYDKHLSPNVILSRIMP